MEQNISNQFALTTEEVNLLREQFIEKYSKQKGWDKNNLSSNQMLEIVTNKEYKNPGLILG
jgi:hypothetical protein